MLQFQQVTFNSHFVILTSGQVPNSVWRNTPAMPLVDAHFGGFFVFWEAEKAAGYLLSGQNVCIFFLTIPAKAMLYGVPSNRRVTCFWETENGL